MYKVVIFLMFILALVLLLHFLSRTKIPKIIWTYWDQDMPEIVRLCMDSWRKHNPNYRIIVLNKNNLRDFIDVDIDTLRHANESPARFSDFVRLNILAKHGGIWMDASIICNKPLTWVHDVQQRDSSEFVGYYIASYTKEKHVDYSKVIESWFLACPLNSTFMKEWCDEFMRMNDFDTVDDYLNDVRARGTDLQHITNPVYLAIHVSAQKVLQDKSLPKFKLSLLKCEDTAMKYLYDHRECDEDVVKADYLMSPGCNWNVENAVRALHEGKYKDQPIIKLRNPERSSIVKYNNIHNIFSESQIPKIVWTYWEGEPPYIVKKCWETWQKHNPSIKIIILSKADLPQYIDIDLDSLKHSNDSPARFSDFVRLHILATHGGIWMDASVICNIPLDWVFETQVRTGCEFIGYKMANHTHDKMKGVCDVIESCIFACIPGAAFVRAWRDEFMTINNFETVKEYMESLGSRGIDLQNSQTHHYWAVFGSLLAVLQSNPHFNNRLHLIEGTQTIYAYQFDHNEHSHETQVASLFQGAYKTQPLIKLTNWDRAVIERNHMNELHILFD